MGFLLGMAKIVFSFHIIQCMARKTIKSTKFFQQIELHHEVCLVRYVSNDKYLLTILNDETTSSTKSALEKCSCERKSRYFMEYDYYYFSEITIISRWIE